MMSNSFDFALNVNNRLSGAIATERVTIEFYVLCNQDMRPSSGRV